MLERQHDEMHSEKWRHRGRQVLLALGALAFLAFQYWIWYVDPTAGAEYGP